MFLTTRDVDFLLKPFGTSPEYKVPRYPLTDIGVDMNDNLHIQVACAGFSKEDITIEQKGNRLIITGVATDDTESPEINWLQKHISTSDFVRTIVLHDDYIDGKVFAAFNNGILSIVVSPVEEQPKTIGIN